MGGFGYAGYGIPEEDDEQRQVPPIARLSPASSLPPVAVRGIGTPASSTTPPVPLGSVDDPEARAMQSHIAPRPIAQPSPIAARTAADQNELSREQTTGSGVSQIAKAHPIAGGILRGLATAGSIAGSVFPQVHRALSATPGTEEHHQQLIGQTRGRIGEDLGEQEKEATTGEVEARTEQAQAAAEKDRKAAEAGQVKDEQILYDKNGTPIGYRDAAGLYHGKDDPFLPQGVRDVLAAAQPKEPLAKAAHVNYDAGIPVSVTDRDGTVYDVNDPNLPPALKPLADSANRAHGKHVQEQKDVAASGQAASADRQKNTEDFQKQEKGREHITKIESDYQDAASKAELIRDAIAQAQAGNKMAASFQGMLATLGITTMEGVKRVNAVELGIPTGAGSLWDTVRNKLGKWTAGQPMDASLQKDLAQLADTIQQASYKKYSSEHGRISKRYGLTDEEPLPAPGGAQNGAKDFGAAPAGKAEDSTGSLPDGTKVIVKGGRLVAQ